MGADNKLLSLTAIQLAKRIANGEVSSRQATEAVLTQIEGHDPQIHAFVSVQADAALQAAGAIDHNRAAGKSLGPLGGVPIAIKDNFCTTDSPTTCASKILDGFIAPYNATVVEKLLAAGAIIVGKTNMDEFAMGSSTEHSSLGATRNPWDTSTVPGGSSGGAAAATAARMCYAALGSDTGGSIRQPAAFCGVVGFKPTYGRVSRYGLVAFASSLDQIGPLTQDVADTALLTRVIAGHDSRDSTSATEPVPDYLDKLDQPLKPLRIGVAKEYFGEGLDPEIETATRAAIRCYEQMGADVEEVSLPHGGYGIAAYYIVATAEASSNLARYDGVHYGYRAADCEDIIDMYAKSRAEGFGAEVKRRVMIGTHVLSSGYYDAYYLKALKVRRLIKEDFDRAFSKVDVVVGPTSPTAAFKAGERMQDPLVMYLSDIYTNTCNLAGIVGISVPCGFTSRGLPIGLQLLAAPFQEHKLLRVARMFESATEHSRAAPLTK